VIGLGVGLILIPIVAVTIAPLFRAFGGSKSGAH
jgi:hypothetical protein